MDIEQIKELMNHLEASKLKKLVLKRGDFELQLEKESLNPPVRTRVVATESDAPFQSGVQSETSLKGERGGSVRLDAPGTYDT